MGDDIKTIAASVRITGEALLVQYKNKLGAEWESFKQVDKTRVERLFKDMAKLSLQAASGIDVDSEMVFIEASVANLKAKYTIKAASLVWEVSQKILGVAAKAFSDALVAGVDRYVERS